jgi:signal transduction histidine kinase
MNRVIHEIRNHLAVAIANVEAFRDGVLEPTPPRLSAVLQALGEVEVLLRDVPRGGAGPEATFDSTTREFNVCEVIANELLGLEASARERAIGLRVSQCAGHGVSAAEGCLRFAGDPLRIAEIVNNVVSNAIRYTPAGASIEVDCRPRDGVLTLTVTDDGPGVRPDEMGEIFTPGFRGSAAVAKRGSGLGLPLVKAFVEQHGGTIAVENIPGRGARFTLRLPGTPLMKPQPAGGIASLL